MQRAGAGRSKPWGSQVVHGAQKGMFDKYCTMREPCANPLAGASGARERSGLSWPDNAGGDDFSGDEDAISVLRRCLFDGTEYIEGEV